MLRFARLNRDDGDEAGNVPRVRGVGRAVLPRDALEALRKETPIVAQEVVDMRKRVTDLAEENKKLAERLDDLEQRLGAKEEVDKEAKEETSDQD